MNGMTRGLSAYSWRYDKGVMADETRKIRELAALNRDPKPPAEKPEQPDTAKPVAAKSAEALRKELTLK